MAVLRVGELPEEALAAAAAFYAEVMPGVLTELEKQSAPIPLPLAGGVRGGPVGPEAALVHTDPPPTPPASGMGEDFILIFPPADHTQRAWRLAAVQSLARKYAPFRVNALAGNSEKAIAAAVAYLDSAEGVTGQLLELDDTGAGQVVSSPT
jgi:hypothetical protein